MWIVVVGSFCFVLGVPGLTVEAFHGGRRRRKGVCYFGFLGRPEGRNVTGFCVSKAFCHFCLFLISDLFLCFHWLSSPFLFLSPPSIFLPFLILFSIPFLPYLVNIINLPHMQIFFLLQVNTVNFNITLYYTRKYFISVFKKLF